MTYRIAMVAACPYPVPQGSQVLLRDTARALHARGHVVYLVVYGFGVGAEDEAIAIRRCARIPGMRRTAAGPHLGKAVLDLALVRTLRRVIRTEQVDVVHAHNYEGLIVALAARRFENPTLPVVYHAHNAMADELPHFIRSGQKLGAWLDRTFPRRADHVIVPHVRLSDYLVHCGCARSQISVIPPSVNADVFTSRPVCADMPPVLYTGNLDSYQNLDLLLRAMERVRAVLPAARLLIATAQSKDIPGATHVPARDFDAIREILAQDAVVACPRVSWSGYPIKLLNAMAAGKAIVACEGAAHPLVHGRTGLIVPDNDERIFAEAIIRLLKDPELRAELGTCARRAVAAAHTPENAVCQIEDAYRSVCR